MKIEILNWTATHAEILVRCRDQLISSESERDAILKLLAIDAEGLPVYADIGGCVVLTELGEVKVVEFHEEGEILSDSFDPEWIKWAWNEGKRKFPSLFENLAFNILGSSPSAQ